MRSEWLGSRSTAAGSEQVCLQEESYSDEDSGTEEVSDADYWRPDPH